MKLFKFLTRRNDSMSAQPILKLADPPQANDPETAEMRSWLAQLENLMRVSKRWQYARPVPTEGPPEKLLAVIDAWLRQHGITEPNDVANLDWQVKQELNLATDHTAELFGVELRRLWETRQQLFKQGARAPGLLLTDDLPQAARVTVNAQEGNDSRWYFGVDVDLVPNPEMRAKLETFEPRTIANPRCFHESGALPQTVRVVLCGSFVNGRPKAAWRFDEIAETMGRVTGCEIAAG